MRTLGALSATADELDAEGWSGRSGRTGRTLLFSSGKEYDIAHRWIGRAGGEGGIRKKQ